MTHLSTETCRVRRLAVLCFFVFTVLFLAAASRPWVIAQAGWRVDLKEGDTAASSLSIRNRCQSPHNFRVESKFKGLRFDEPTDSIRIEQGATKTIPALFDAHGLKENVYRGKVDVECLDCKEETGCSQDRDELAVEMNVVKAFTNVAKGNASTASEPKLILNKHHEPNQSSTSWNIGVPITYVIEVRNSGADNSNITVSDALPPGFVVVSTTCTANSGATCPGPNLPPPPFALFYIPMGGSVEIRMTGYFTTGGPKINTAIATAKDTQGNALDVGSSNSSIDQLQVPVTASPVNIAVTKSGSPTTSTLPAQVHYSVTVKNLTTTDVYLGGNFRLRDVFSISPFVGLNWTVSNIVCTPSGGAVCPDLPASVPSNTSQILFPYNASGGPTANDSGWMPGLGSYKIDFDVDISKNATCGPSQVSFRNQAGLDSLSSFSDSNPGDNWSAVVSTAISTGLIDCVPPPAGLELSKKQCTTTTGSCTPGNTANWNAPVRYRITIRNPTAAALSNVLLSDEIFKTTGTPTFTATLNPNEPHCVSGCTTLTPGTPISPPTVNIDYATQMLWTATLPSLAPSQTAEIDYIVVYAPLCETDKTEDHIRNRVSSGSLAPEVDTKFLEADPCNLTAEKTKVTPGPIVFGQPMTYNVTFSNPSAATLDVGTIRDVLSNTSSTYGSFKIDSTATCSLNSGTVSLPTGHQPFPFQVNLSGIAVNYSPVGWQGALLLNERMTFGPNSSVQCQIKVTAHKPADSNPFCQGAGNPQLRNAFYGDLSTNYSPVSEPSIYDVEVADLPLCRSVIVTKVATNHNYGPGAPVTYTITVENKGQHPVINFVLKDMVPPALLPATAGTCSPPAACIAGPAPISTTGQLDVSYGPLAPNTPVSFLLNATAPQAGGPIGNTAVGSFLPGGNFYFHGDEVNFLRQEENIQVLTPVMSKRYDPVQIGPSGTSTLTFNITNTNSDPKQTGINFSDTLPAGLQITNVISNGCGGAVTTSTDGHTVTLTGGQLVGPNADGSGKHSCQISVQVKASGECGVMENKKANFTQVNNLDVSNINEQLEVTGCPPKNPPKLDKIFETANIGLGGTTTLAFTITNSSGDPKQTGIAFSDTLPAGLQIVSVVSNSCSGTVSISSDGRTVTLAGGQLVGSNADGSGQHSCKIVVKVKAVGDCGVYRNSKENFSELKNLDISGVGAQLQVDCGPGSGLIVQKKVEGAPPGFSGQFNFLVQCATPNGFYQKAVIVNWPTPGFTVLNDVPAGSQCIVTEGPPPASLPANYAWAGLPSYLPQGGLVSVGPRGGKVTVTDTLSLCNETGQVTITKVVKGLPKDYIGVFEGTLQCWIGDKLQTFPVTLTSPNGLSTTIGDIPLGSTCTFQETGLPPLTGDFKWDLPVYSPLFGTVTLNGECCQQVTATNEARHCCTPAKGSGYEPIPNNSSAQSVNRAPSAGTAKGEPARRKQVPRQKRN